MHEGLLRKVLEDPADDMPRLVLADWLEEHGEEERAEFIRVQVELETTGPMLPPGTLVKRGGVVSGIHRLRLDRFSHVFTTVTPQEVLHRCGGLLGR